MLHKLFVISQKYSIYLYLQYLTKVANKIL